MLVESVKKYIRTRNFQITAFLFVLALLIFYGLRYSSLRINMPEAQLVVFPIILLVFLRLRLARQKLPFLVVFLALCGTIFGAASIYSYRSGVLVARLDGDEFEIQSRLFRERFNKYLKPSALLKVYRFNDPFHSDAEIKERFPVETDINAVVWGNSEWINVSFNQLEVNDDNRDKSLASMGIRFINHVPSLGLSYEPEIDTIRFLAALFSGLYYEQYVEGLSPAEIWAHKETYLLRAADLTSLWNSYAHRAYPLWVLGNQYFKNAFSESEVQIAELDCAFKAYGEALGFLRAMDNPGLRAAIYNNLAIALIAKGQLEGDLKLLLKTKKYFKAALQFLVRQNRFGSKYENWKAVYKNLKQVRKIIKLKQGKKKSKKRKKFNKRNK